MPRPLRPVSSDQLDGALRTALDGTGPAVVVGQARAATVPDKAAVVVRTSGSTGDPHDVMLTADGLIASAEATAARIGTGQWLLALPVSHVAGLQVLVRSVLAGTSPVVLPDGPFRPGTFVEAVDRLDGPAYCSLVPTQLLRLLDDPAAAAALHRFDAVLVGGAALAPALRARAAEADVRVVTTYGATETSGGAVYDGRPLDGVDVQVVDGTVTVSGPVLALGYLGRPDLDEARFPVSDGQRRFVSSDLGAFVDGRLTVTGRADDIIVTGGVKVAPAAVERILAGLPGVRDVCVVGPADPHWGQVVTAVVVAAPGTTIDPDALRSAVAGTLGPAAAPHRVVQVDTLATLPSGKHDRAATARVAARKVNHG